MKFELKYQPEKGGDWPFRVQYDPMNYGPVPMDQLKVWDDWCRKCATDRGWWRSGSSYWFMHREEALMFIMRWL